MMHGIIASSARSYWKYHTVIIRPRLDWISAARFHPVNIMLGSVATNVNVAACWDFAERHGLLGPFTIAHSTFVHANLS